MEPVVLQIGPMERRQRQVFQVEPLKLRSVESRVVGFQCQQIGVGALHDAAARTRCHRLQRKGHVLEVGGVVRLVRVTGARERRILPLRRAIRGQHALRIERQERLRGRRIKVFGKRSVGIGRRSGRRHRVERHEVDWVWQQRDFRITDVEILAGRERTVASTPIASRASSRGVPRAAIGLNPTPVPLNGRPLTMNVAPARSVSSG